MGGRQLTAAQMPTPGPWLVRREAEADAPAKVRLLGIEPAAKDRPGSFPYLVRQDRPFTSGECPLHLAVGIQRLADARLMAAAPDLASMLLNVLIVRELRSSVLDHETQKVVVAAWNLLVRVTPHLEI
ncbi:hypothetical protein [Methylobacterium sp. R2-1]|uniref:hypothetical protein n=1 Tax=Methylobacterium sp. R2-1 TaxID=2587064 RepID=UPI0016220AA7|nr:hypothetical protein [Methylobacterium sp. R2-1]MBB2963519.1 hypothetical protein [Methylobacterium sp. R2-1]